ncbi:AAA family ATPase [Roseomonas sp. KE2513]|uniref:AAA family ATPase n=1 Tax=Roseomonas sp. KE2513 TaxID=2479202 RepID=UPI0018E04767|nr:AAA family ATPase [Roseomonas sp. KE2513]
MSHAGWAAARRAILQAFATGEHLVALLGPPGVGKTCLLRDIEAALRPQSIRVQRLESGDAAEGVLEARPDTEVLLVDEADRMSEATLEEVAEREGCFAVLVGLPALARRIAPWPHRVVQLEAIPQAEIRSYLAARMIIAELDSSRLTDEAAAALAELSAGTPRLLNLLLAMAFHEADMTDQRDVTASHVREAAALRAEAAPHVQVGEDASALEPAASKAGPPETVPRRADLSLVPATVPEEEPPPRSRFSALALLTGAALVLGGLAWVALTEAPRPAARPASVPQPAAGAATELAGPASAVLASSAPPPPTTAAATGIAGLPTGAMVRVVVTYPRGVAEAGRRASAIAAALAGAGISVGAPFPVARPPAGPSLSYFFHEDREAAGRVARLVGLDGVVPQLGPASGAAPRPGTIEIALAALGTPTEEREALPQEEAPAPLAATPVYPPEGAILPPDAGWRGVVLAWSAPLDARPNPFFVEVVSLGTGRAAEPAQGWSEAFAAYAEAPDAQLLQLSGPGRYAWRVLTVSRTSRRYAAGPWHGFAVGGPPS